MEVEILQANINNAPLLSELGITTFEETFAHLNTAENMKRYFSSPLSTVNLEKELSNDDNRFFIVYSETLVAGYLKLRTAKKPQQLQGLKALEIERF